MAWRARYEKLSVKFWYQNRRAFDVERDGYPADKRPPVTRPIRYDTFWSNFDQILIIRKCCFIIRLSFQNRKRKNSAGHEVCGNPERQSTYCSGFVSAKRTQWFQKERSKPIRRRRRGLQTVRIQKSVALHSEFSLDQSFKFSQAQSS